MIQDRYGGAQRNVGTSAIVDTLHGFFGTRYAMNQQAAEDDGGRDADKLAEMELDAREGLGKLQRALTEARSGDTRSYNDLVGTVIKTKGGMAEASARASADVQKQKIWMRAKWMEKADQDKAALGAASRYSDATREQVRDVLPGSVMSGNVQAQGNTLAAHMESLLQTEKAGGFGNAKYDTMVSDAYNALVRAGRREAADVMARKLQPSAGMDPNQWFEQKHARMTPKEADEYAKEIGREYNAGVSTGEVDTWLRGMGIEPSEIGMPGEDTETTVAEEASGGVGGGTRGAGSGGVRAKGLSAGAADVLVTARDRGEDPYSAILKAIQQQTAFADQLAAERKAVSERRRSTYPKANPFVSTPNTYVSEEAQSAARRVGQNDPGLNKAWAGALIAEGGNVPRAYESLREDGGAQPRYTAKAYRAEALEEGGDLGSHLAAVLGEAVDVTDPDGKWAYRLNPDLTVTITRAPPENKSAVNTVVRRGSKQWDAIMGVAGEKAPLTKMATVVGQQPAEVQALFGDAWAMAINGDPKRAGELAREVSADDVRAAYGQAMQRAEKRPEEIEAIRAGLDALPEDVKAGWSAPFYDVLDEYGRNQHVGGYLAAGGARGSIGALGQALEQSRGTGQRRKALERVAGEENKTDVRQRGFYDQGRDLALKGLQGARDDWEQMEVRRGWESAHRNAPSDLTRGALDALGVADTRGTDALALERTGRMQVDIPVAPVDIVGKTPAHADISRTPTTIVETREADPPDDDAANFDTFLDAAPRGASR